MNRVRAILLATVGSFVLVGCAVTPVSDDPSIAPQASNEIAETNTKLGIEYIRQDRLELAWKRLSTALEYDPNYSTAHNAMAHLNERLGQPEIAEKHFKKAVSLNPSDSSAQNNYGRFLCTLGRYEEAEQHFEQAVNNSLYNKPELAYSNAGVCAKKAGDRDRAETYLRKALETNPRMPSALLNMADLSFDKEQFLSARGYLQRFEAISVQNPQSLWLGVQVERALGDQKRGGELCGRLGVVTTLIRTKLAYSWSPVNYEREPRRVPFGRPRISADHHRWTGPTVARDANHRQSFP